MVVMVISPSSEYSGLISFRIDWFDPFAVQGTLKSLLQHHNLKASILQCSVLHGPTLTSVHTTGKTILPHFLPLLADPAFNVTQPQDFSGDPVVKNPPSNAGDMDWKADS